jgi:hypothetical protein
MNVKGTTKSLMIKHFSAPACISCRFFRRNPQAPKDLSLGLCSKFKYKDIISGEIRNEYAQTMRISDTDCGVKGKRYEPVQFKPELK